jgi:hypothetical protein
MVRTDVLSHGRDEAPLGVHDLVAQVVSGVDDLLQSSIEGLRSANQALRPTRRTRSSTVWCECAEGGPLSHASP